MTDVPPTTALVLVECQQGLLLQERAILPELAKVAEPRIPAMGRLAAGARAAGLPVVHAIFVPAFETRSSNRMPRMFPAILPRQQHWTMDHPDVQPPPEIGVGPDDLVLPRRSGLSPAYRTELFPLLRNLGITTIVLAGVSTNIAMPVVATEAVDEGFYVTIPRDAVAGTPESYMEDVLRYTLSPIATLTTVDGLLDEWGVPAG